MTHGEKRRRFTFFLAKLIVYANECGYGIAIDGTKEATGHIENSFHPKGLAADMNLYKGETWLKNTEDHRFLGDYWKSLDSMCTWGGDFKSPDGNHYSYGEGK
jgi:hypothetical protein